MRKLPRPVLSLATSIAALLVDAVMPNPVGVHVAQAATNPAYVTGYFRSGPNQTNKQEKLFLGFSRDGLHWYELNNNQPVFTPTIGEGILRDPFIKKGPDGNFHIVFTMRPAGSSIGYVSSPNLITFNNEKALNVMSNYTDVSMSWAPEWSWDAANNRYMVYWSSGVGQNGCTTCYNQQYTAYTTDWTNMSNASLLWGPGHSTIDPNITAYNGNYYMFYKDEALSPMKTRFASSSSLTGGYSGISSPITPDYTEAPEVLQLTGQQKFYLYYDYWSQGKYGIMQSTDMTNWSQELSAASFRFPYERRHATFLPVTDTDLFKLINNYSLAARYRMNASSGTTLNDATSHNNDGTVYGATWTTAGKVNGALAFNGVGDYAQIVDNTTDQGFMHYGFTIRSVSMWVKANSTGGTQVLYDEGGNTAGFAVEIDNGTLKAAVAEGGVSTIVSTPFTDTTAWHHVAATFADGTLKLYLDGIQNNAATASYTAVDKHIDYGGLGMRLNQDAFGGKNGGAYFDGKLDEVNVYNIPLQNEDVTYLFNNPGA